MTFVLTGSKAGDTLAALPVIYHSFVTTKAKPTVVVSKQYGHIFERVPYANAVQYSGEWGDLKGALLFAKRHYNDVVCLSTFGHDFNIEHRHSSFVLDMYDRAGLLHLYDTLPLVIDYTPAPTFVSKQTRPMPKIGFPRPTILFAEHSQSSPFLAKQELFTLLVESFPKHDVLRLSDVRLAHVADFVGWYNHASALVSIETSHLHLSAATRSPVFVFATDKPSKWHGSAWSKRFSFYARYSEFEARKTDLIDTMRDTLASRLPMGVKGRSNLPEIAVLN